MANAGAASGSHAGKTSPPQRLRRSKDQLPSNPPRPRGRPVGSSRGSSQLDLEEMPLAGHIALDLLGGVDLPASHAAPEASSEQRSTVDSGASLPVPSIRNNDSSPRAAPARPGILAAVEAAVTSSTGAVIGPGGEYLPGGQQAATARPAAMSMGPASSLPVPSISQRADSRGNHSPGHQASAAPQASLQPQNGPHTMQAGAVPATQAGAALLLTLQILVLA